MLNKALTAYLHLLSDFIRKWRLFRSVGWARQFAAQSIRLPLTADLLASDNLVACDNPFRRKRRRIAEER